MSSCTCGHAKAMSAAKVRLHESLIRFAKGMLKAWEEWIQAEKQ